ncbi:MAG: hypothetical protein HY962_09990 [Ignavibacteriae bacterium]|nr:hypothetical protein [Ignavibacteriota bacterium]
MVILVLGIAGGVLPCVADAQEQGDTTTQDSRTWVFPRMRDTIDAYACRYFGMLPACGDVRRIVGERRGAGTALHVSRPTGDTVYTLDAGGTALMRVWIEHFEAIQPSLVRNERRIGWHPIVIDKVVYDFTPLLQEGLVRPRHTDHWTRRPVSISPRGSAPLSCDILYAGDSTIIIREEDDSRPWMSAAKVLRLSELSSIESTGYGSFGRGFVWGLLGSISVFVILVDDASSAHGSVTDGYGASAVIGGGFAGLFAGSLTGIVTMLAGGEHAVYPCPEEGLGISDAMPVLRARSMFPSIPPPEYLPLLSRAERDRVLAQIQDTAEAAAPPAETTDAVGEEPAPLPRDRSARGFLDHATVFWDLGVNLYLGYTRGTGSWTGAYLASALSLFGTKDETITVLCTPRIGAGFEYALAGCDIGLLLKRRVTVTAGLTWQWFHEPFGRFDRESYEYLDTSPFRNNLFYSGAVEADLGAARFVLRISSAAGRPVVTTSQHVPDTGPAVSDTRARTARSFFIVGFSVGWDIPGL